MKYNDSIRPNLDKTTIENEIKMQLTAPNNTEKAFILVEGEDDISVLGEILDENNTILYESYGGKQDIINLMKNEFSDDKRVVAIVDKDYDEKIEDNRIFYYDYCNLEMMIISDDKVFNKLIFKLITKRADYIPYRTLVLNNLSAFSAVRKTNDAMDWGLNLSKVPIVGFFNTENNARALVYSLVQSKNSIDFELDKKQLCEKTENEIINTNLLDYTNGHDFCEALSLYLKTVYTERRNIKKLGAKDVELLLSMVFDIIAFSRTQLFQQVKQYQESNNLKIINDWRN